MLNLKAFDEEFHEYTKLKQSLYRFFLKNREEINPGVLAKYDRFIELYEKMKKTYGVKIKNKKFIKWLDDIDEFTP